MIAYNPSWLANLRLQEQAKKDAARGIIRADEYQAILQHYHVGFYMPNFIVRVGLFILTCIIVSFSDGLISLVFASSGMVTAFGWFIFLGIVTYAMLELMIRTNFHYRSGVDDALLIIAACQLATGIGFGLYSGHHDSANLLFAALLFLLSIALTLRFADMLMALVACGSFFALVFFGWTQMVPAGLTTVPFAMMLAGGGVYWLAFTYSKHKACINYNNCLTIAQVLALAVLYAAGNFYVIDNLGREMAGRKGPVPVKWLFWNWSMLLPFVYIWLGINNKSVIFLRVGLLALVAAGATFRNYIHLMPVDVALTIIGAALLTVSLGVSRYLKNPKHGLTVAEPEDLNTADLLKAEALVAAGSFSHPHAAPAANGNDSFGGGSFGGGGSSAGY